LATREASAIPVALAPEKNRISPRYRTDARPLDLV